MPSCSESMSISLSSKSEMRSAFLDSNMNVTTSPVSSALGCVFFGRKEVEVERERAENLNETRKRESRRRRLPVNSIFEFGGSATALQLSFSSESREATSLSRLERAEAGSRPLRGELSHETSIGLRLSFHQFSLSKKSLTFIVTVSSLLAHLSILAMLLRLMPIDRLRSQR